MRLAGYKRLVLAIAGMIGSATLVHATLTPGDIPGRSFLAGQVLIASPAMGDPRFDHTVILIVRHDQDGALGIVINRPIGQRSLSALLHGVGPDGGSATKSVTIYRGGPVNAEQGFVVHSAEYHRGETIDIDGRVAMTASPEILRDIANNSGPGKSLIALGYAGWGPGQLEGEIARVAWFTAPEDPVLIFDDDRAEVWEHAMRRRTQDL